MRKLTESLEAALLKYGVAALLIVIPLYPKFPLFKIPGSWVSIRLEDFLIALVTLIWLLSLFRHKLQFFKDDFNKTVLAYFLIGFLSFLSAVFITHSVVPHVGLLHTLRRVEYMIVLFIMVSSVKTFKEAIFYLEVIFLTLFFVFLYGVGQKFFLFPVISTMNVEFAKGFALRLHPGARVSSTFAGHYDLAAYLVLMLPLTVAVFVAVRKRWLKLMIGGSFILSYWLMLLSASRISFFAYLVSITFTLWFLKKRLWVIPVVCLSVATSFMAPQLMNRYNQTFQVTLLKIKQIKFTLPWEKQPTIISFVPEVTPTPPPPPVSGQKPIPTIVKKIRQITTPTPTPFGKKIVFYGAGTEIPQTEDRSAAIRLKVEWPRAIRAWQKNPFLGTGYSSITLATDNDYLRVLGEVGLIGFLAFMLVLLKIGQKIRNFLSTIPHGDTSRTIIIGILGGIIGFLANAVFIDVFEASKVAITFWLLMGLALSIIKVTQKEVRV